MLHRTVAASTVSRCPLATTSPAAASAAASALMSPGCRRSSHSHHDGNNSHSKRRDYRGPLLVGGSLVGASTLQYYLHQRAFTSPVILGQGHAHAQLVASTSAATTIGAAAAATFSTTAATSSPATNATTSTTPSPTMHASSVASRPLSSSASTSAPTSYSSSANPLEGLRITLYQYKICPFCCKVKAVLDYYKIPYETMDVNPLTKAEIKFSADYRKVPIARIGDEVVIDSSIIVGKIMDLLRAAHVAPAKELDAFFAPEATRWAEWADMELAVLLFPNITRTFGESYQAFSYVKDVPHFSMLDKLTNQWIGATAMWAAQGKIKKKYNITDERAALFAALETWSSEVGNKPFLSGSTPNVGDLCVYACIRAIEGLDAHKDLLANTGIGPWYTRVEHAIGASSCVHAE
ncbi:hypothetical protein VYU27_004807 [Nannochloropsis oceanica]